VELTELLREVYESERYETNEDYRLNEGYRFVSLDEVEEFVGTFGHTLKDIKWGIELKPVELADLS
jgi:hypothetical protein